MYMCVCIYKYGLDSVAFWPLRAFWFRIKVGGIEGAGLSFKVGVEGFKADGIKV